MGLSSFPQPDVPSLLQAITTTGEALSQHEPGAREKLLKLSYSLSAALETTGETIQRIGWAEVHYQSYLAVEVLPLTEY